MEQHFQGPEDMAEKRIISCSRSTSIVLFLSLRTWKLILSDKELRKALLQSNCKRADSKLEFLQDGVALSNHPLFATD